MITEIWIEGQSLDVYEKTNIKHTMQVNDVAEVKDRQASLTDSFDIPKTPKNVRIFEGLGIHSNTSLIPYQKPKAMLKVDGYDFLSNAWLNVKEADNEYKIYIYSGIIEFFKKFENKTIGGSLDLSAINHSKNLATVAASQIDDTLKYTYLFADFNGRTHRIADANTVNIDFVVPSVSVSYLFDIIHQKAGYTYSGSFILSEDFVNWWMTYPKAPEDTTAIVYYSDSINIPFTTYPVNLDESLTFSFNNGSSNGIKADATAFYNFDFSGSAGLDLPIPSGYGSLNYQFYYKINNGVKVYISNTAVFDLQLLINDVIDFGYELNADWSGNVGANLTVKKLEDVVFSDALNDLKITDFLKDIYNELGLTPFINNVTKNIEYKTNKERFKEAEVEDWTNYLESIEKESYSFGSYAKQNYFRYKYNDQEESHSDGFISINNENLDDTKTIFSSFTYSPEKDSLTDFYLNSSNTEKVSVFKLYDKEAQDGSTEVKYKGLSKRYFFMRMRKINISVQIGSDIQNTNQTVTTIKIGEFSRLKMDYFLGNYYTDFINIISIPIIWNVKLNIPYPKLLKVDLSKAYYFRQLQQYCLINKLSFDEKSCNAELVKIKDFLV
ncbi:hypothetical protein PFY12_14470 [Chryseobacterium camelliae]|uniref:MACPF domain-containing protein n=1 Tax=Chryseobacterium camelliae TaxID=1265445 RepID=A0ABY7QKQ5_9FLAO|nr:hypothetical protein [Chryseobacterium camelliae]WBV60229.1 hypothetical protein PFY12_14470 [Chryseobacterium camelliae]